jgi:hypothetical protein
LNKVVVGKERPTLLYEEGIIERVFVGVAFGKLEILKRKQARIIRERLSLLFRLVVLLEKTNRVGFLPRETFRQVEFCHILQILGFFN